MSGKKVIKAWGGFTDGESDLCVNIGEGERIRSYEIYKTRRESRAFFSDVRPIEIHIPESSDER